MKSIYIYGTCTSQLYVISQFGPTTGRPMCPCSNLCARRCARTDVIGLFPGSLRREAPAVRTTPGTGSNASETLGRVLTQRSTYCCDMLRLHKQIDSTMQMFCRSTTC